MIFRAFLTTWERSISLFGKLFGANFFETYDNISFRRDPGVNTSRVPDVKCLTIQVLALSPLCTSSQDPLLCERNPETTKHENKNKLTVSQHFMFLSCHKLLRSVRNGDLVSSWHEYGHLYITNSLIDT